MSAPRLTTRSLRSVRAQARVPGILAAVLVVVLSAAGLRATLAGPPPSPSRPTVVRVATGDPGASAFAEAFTHAYLGFDAAHPAARERALRPFVGTRMDADAGVQPASAVTQHVAWTTVVGAHRDGGTQLVTVLAQTSDGTRYLNVPVTRDAHGFLAVAGYPALVGPPAVDTAYAPAAEADVEDPGLVEVISRALGNYLATNRRNLLADLTPDAVVSLPAEPLVLDGVDATTWVTAGRRLAAVVQTHDRQGTTWTLRYELDVLHRDRWYVRSFQVDPAFQGGQ